ncbi:hypothetical protein [Solibacillus sp. FSL H8-0538]|uniref:hypothetical protein n=1 Tax=Solibacillus sp. FSL H8-0538 TaxID=2921400 RepID=UPI004046FD80
MGKTNYAADIKWAVVKEKITGELTNEQLMIKYGIKNRSQINSWMIWYRNN